MEIDLNNNVYKSWFLLNTYITRKLNKVSLVAGAIWGMLSLEAHVLVKCTYHTFSKYKKQPESYGLNTYSLENKGKNPILLFHGAVGSCNYLTELAKDLRGQGRAVFVLNLGFEGTTEDKRDKVIKEVDKIQNLYVNFFNLPSPKIDFVAHSMGGHIALTSAFTKECSKIDDQDNLQLTAPPAFQSSIGKIVVIANPTIEREFQWVKEACKEDSLFNINAKYDALMGHKECALDQQRYTEIEASHIGIVFHKNLGDTVGQFLGTSCK